MVPPRRPPEPLALANPMPRRRVRYYVISPKERGPGLEIRAVPKRWRLLTRERVSRPSQMALIGLIIAQQEGPARAIPTLEYAWERREAISGDHFAASRLRHLVFSIPLNAQITSAAPWGVSMISTAYAQVLADSGDCRRAREVLDAEATDPDARLVQSLQIDLATRDYASILARTDNRFTVETDLEAYVLTMRVAALQRTGRVSVAEALARDILRASSTLAPPTRHLALLWNAKLAYAAGRTMEALQHLDGILRENTGWAAANALYEEVALQAQSASPGDDAH